MPRTDHTAILFVLDRSGSMHTISDDVVGGFGAFVAEQRALPGTATLTLVQFDDRYETVYVDRPLDEVPLPLRHEPRGTTALLDAIARGVGQLSDTIARRPEADRPGQVVVAIMTDGAENASTEVNLATVRDLIRKKRERDGWEFLYLGANVDAFGEAQAMGIGRSAGFRASPTGTARAMADIGTLVSYVRTHVTNLDALHELAEDDDRDGDGPDGDRPS